MEADTIDSSRLDSVDCGGRRLGRSSLTFPLIPIPFPMAWMAKYGLEMHELKFPKAGKLECLRVGTVTSGPVGIRRFGLAHEMSTQ